MQVRVKAPWGDLVGDLADAVPGEVHVRVQQSIMKFDSKTGVMIGHPGVTVHPDDLVQARHDGRATASIEDAEARVAALETRVAALDARVCAEHVKELLSPPPSWLKPRCPYCDLKELVQDAASRLAPRLRAGVVVRREGKVLLAQSHQPHEYQRWVLPAVTVAWHEQLDEAVRRAARDLGIKCEPGRPLGPHASLGSTPQRHAVTLYYEAIYVDGKPGEKAKFVDIPSVHALEPRGPSEETAEVLARAAREKD